MNLLKAYEFGQKELSLANIEDAATDAWYLLEFVTGVSRQAYFMNAQVELEKEQESTYRTYIEMRKSHIPLQHITGEQEFMGFTFQVNEHVLVPRQDTEVLVESVLDVLDSERKVLDMCTGSGCILISLMKLGNEVQGTGVDISTKALEVAKQNAKRLGVTPTFLHSDLFENVSGRYDIIVSNPPYIRTKVIEELADEVKLHDPMIALDGKEDGLYFYRKIIAESPNYLENGGGLYFEIGHDQGEDVKTLMIERGFSDVTVKKDLAGLDRVVFGVYNT